MFNPQIIYNLLDANGLKQKELLDFIGKNHNGSMKQLLRGDVKASNLEKFSEFFGVPIDYFFDKSSPNSGVVVGGVGNKVHHFSVNSDKVARERLEALVTEKESMIAEKEKRIKVLEEMVGLLKAQLSTK